MQFNKIHVVIRERKDINWTAKGVYAYMLDLQGIKERCWPSERTIADACAISRGGARRSIAALVKAGLLEAKKSGSGRNSFVLYRVVEPEELVPERDQVVPKRDHSEGGPVVPKRDHDLYRNGTISGTETVPKVVPKRDHIQTADLDQTKNSDLPDSPAASSGSCTHSVAPSSPKDEYHPDRPPWWEPPPPPPPPPVYSPLHDALVDAFRMRNLNAVDHARIEGVATQLAALGAQPADVPERLATFRLRWPTTHPKPESLLANWAKLGDGPLKLATA